MQRRARDENGKSILVPQNMSYEQWQEKYVTNNSSSGIINKNISKEEKELKYKDITNQYTNKKNYQIKKQKYFINDDGNKYVVDGKHVILKPTQREIEVAELLGQAIGGKVNIIPRINEPPNIKTPDYIINNERFDLKQITGGGKYVIEGNLRKKKKQSNNFIIDLTNAKIDFKEAERQIESIYISKRYLWIDKIFIIKENSIVKIYKRK